MGSTEFRVGKINGLSFGSDRKHKLYAILENSARESVFIPAESLGNSVGEICVGSNLVIETNDNGEVTGVSRVPSQAPSAKPPIS